MKNAIYTTAAFIIAIAVVTTTRFVVPALVLVFKAIEESYAPKDEALVLEMTPEQEIDDLKVLLDDLDAEYAAELLETSVEKTEPAEAAEPAAVKPEAPKPRRRRARKAPVTA